MATLQTQYKNYLKENPDSTLTFDEWFKKWGEINNLPINFEPYISDDFQIGPDGAFEYTDDMEDWDNTLMDGIEDDDWDD
jgi:hypothetical protein